MKKVSIRVLDALLKYQEQSNLDIMPTQSELARLSDTSRQYVNQWLVYMRKKNRIETNGSVYWKVTDINKLTLVEIVKYFKHVRDDIYTSPTMRQMCLIEKGHGPWKKMRMILDGALPIHGKHCKLLIKNIKKQQNT